MTSPEIVTVTEADGIDRPLFEEIRSAADKWAKDRLPGRFRSALVTVPQMGEWVRGLVALSIEERGAGDPIVRSGQSLLLTGPVGVGKTHEAYAALRALQVSGVHCRWEFVHELEFFDQLRPCPGVNHQAIFEMYADADLLVFDDLGSEKRTEWTEVQLLRLVNRRYQNCAPTLFTTNTEPSRFTGTFGERVTSRLMEMCRHVAIVGQDRRRQA